LCLIIVLHMLFERRIKIDENERVFKCVEGSQNMYKW
jgi:hypothetical protein